ncbi:MAG TPA: hypothetical protein VGA81_11450 [Methylomirabilota bacterium]
MLASPAPGAGDNAAPSLPPGLPAADKARIDKVLAKATVSTRVEIDPYALRLDVVDYLLDHPEFATQVTRALKLARYRIWRTADGLNLDDGWGVTGIMTPIYGEGGLRVIYARGRYEQSVLPDINGQAVILLRYAGAPGSNGRPVLTTSMEVFAQLDSTLLASLAGSIAKSKATSEARHVLNVFSRLSTHLNLRADEILAELARRPEVSKSELEGFRKVLGR